MSQSRRRHRPNSCGPAAGGGSRVATWRRAGTALGNVEGRHGMSGSEPRLPLSEPVKNLVVTYGLRAPLDEAGAIQAVQHIKELAGHTVVLNWGATPFVHEFDRATIINARKGNSRLASHVSFAKFTALTAARCVRWRPSRTLLFPLCFPNLFMQLQATLLSRLSRDFLQIIFQTRTPSPSWRALSRFKVGVLGPCLQQEWAKLGLSTERVAAACEAT